MVKTSRRVVVSPQMLLNEKLGRKLGNKHGFTSFMLSFEKQISFYVELSVFYSLFCSENRFLLFIVSTVLLMQSFCWGMCLFCLVFLSERAYSLFLLRTDIIYPVLLQEKQQTFSMNVSMA